MPALNLLVEIVHHTYANRDFIDELSADNKQAANFSIFHTSLLFPLKHSSLSLMCATDLTSIGIYITFLFLKLMQNLRSHSGCAGSTYSAHYFLSLFLSYKLLFYYFYPNLRMNYYWCTRVQSADIVNARYVTRIYFKSCLL